MNKKIAGFFALLVVGILVVLGIYFTKPYITDTHQRKTSDAVATKGKITIAVDNWIGYFPLCSAEMKRLMRNSGWVFRCEDDKADYAKRMERLKKKEIDFAVATVDSYILNAASRDFPGVIVAVIDESKGGDAVLAWKDKVANLDVIKGRTDLRVVFTPSSPSHHLLKVAADHFGIPELLASGQNRIEAPGSEEALKIFLAKKADIAVLWEPDVSTALEKGKGSIIKLIGTDQTEKLIVDILIAGRVFVENNPEAVKTLLSNYFTALKFYRERPEIFAKEIMDSTKLSAEAVKSMLKGVSFATLGDNAQKWFGISSPGVCADEGLITTIESTVKILINSRDFSSDPIPFHDPYRLTQSRFIEELFAKGIAGFVVPGAKKDAGAVNSLEAKFPLFSEEGWNALREVGTLKVQPINFQSGTADLSMAGKEELDVMASKLKHYPNFRIIIKGHTSLQGDPEANKQLSLERAESVARYLMVTYGMDANRLRAMGMGQEHPLPRLAGESDRAYNYRLPRVEILLVAEVF